MKKILFFICLLTGITAFAQNDTAIVMTETETTPQKLPVKIFYAQKLINANTVEMLKKGHLEFKVLHNFGDIAGKDGGAKAFFGLDGAADIKISFQLALSDKFNIVAARTRGSGDVYQLWEMGFKYRFMQQMENDKKNPISLTAYANAVFSSMKGNAVDGKENSYRNFSDRGSWIVQLMAAKKIGKVSVQLNPTFVHTNYVLPNDQKNVFAAGAAIRIPIHKKFSLIADYFHSFRSQSSRDSLRAKNINLYDVFGIGVEILTVGHVFHLNFTNNTNLLENRFIPHTFTSWGKGQYRWGFTIARDFIVFKKRKPKEVDSK
jgi:hypothetical protein